MPGPLRRKIFVSYSHEDQSVFDDFLKQIHALGKEELLHDLWTDHEIEPSDEWHKKIQTALDNTCLGILLVSADFLTSDDIIKHELPLLLEGREQEKISLGILFVSACPVEEREFKVKVDDEIKTIRLTKYQGLNKPGERLKPKSTQYNTILSRVAGSVHELWKKTSQKEKSRQKYVERHPLLIEVALENDRIKRTYRNNQGRLRSSSRDFGPVKKCVRTWRQRGVPSLKENGLGEDLFDALFGGPDDLVHEILKHVIPAPKGSEPNPIRGAVRLLLSFDTAASAAGLSDLPWSQLVWNKYPLCDPMYGWTTELLRSASVWDPERHIKIGIGAQSSILVVSPSIEKSLRADGHSIKLETSLVESNAIRSQGFCRVESESEARNKLSSGRFDILYLYTRARMENGDLMIELDKENPRWYPISTLESWLGERAPKIAFLNLLGTDLEGLGDTACQLSHRIPFVAVQSWYGSETEPRQKAHSWFESLFGQGQDPVRAFHAEALPTGLVAAAYDEWETVSAERLQATSELAELLLDRREVRRRARELLGNLLDYRTKIGCLIIPGDEASALDLVGGQLLDTFQRRDSKEVVVCKYQPKLPFSATFTRSDLKLEVQRNFEAGASFSLKSALTAKIPRSAGAGKASVLVLSWSPVRIEEDNSLQNVRAWLEYCCEDLPYERPDKLHLLCLLPLDIGKEHRDRLKDLFRDYQEGLWKKDESGETKVVLAPVLEPVEREDLVDFFRDGHARGCPDRLYVNLANRIIKKTQGAFRPTVNLIERGEKTDWDELFETLEES